MKRILKWLLITIAVLATAIIVFLYNPNLVKGPLERRISELSGYSISIKGDLEISIGRITRLSVENLHAEAPAWSEQPGLADIRHLSLALDLPSLFKQAVIVHSLRIEDAQINLETSSGGDKNWLSTKHGTVDNTETSPVVIFRDIQIAGVTVQHIEQSSGRQRVLHIDDLGQRYRDDGMLEVGLNGSFNARPVTYEGLIGPLPNILQGRDVHFDGQGRFGNLDIRVKGLLDDLEQPRQPQFDLVVQGQNIDEITTMLGVDDLGSGNFSLHALGGVAGDHYRTSINGQIGEVSLDLSLSATDLVRLDELDLELAAYGPNLGAVARALGFEHWPDLPFSINGSANRIGNTLNIPRLKLDIGGAELMFDALLSNFPALDSSRVRLGVKGDDIAQFRELLGIKGIAEGPFEVHGRLDVSPQQVELIQVDVETELGQMALSGTLGAAPGYAGSRLHLNLAGKDAHRVMSVFDLDILPSEPYSLDTTIEITENGLLFEKGVFASIKDERIELDGFVSLEPGMEGTDVELRLKGNHLQKTLGKILKTLEFADLPYELSGRLRVLGEALEFDDFTARFADVELDADGLIKLHGGTPHRFNFDWRGENFSDIGDFIKLKFSMDAFVPGQAYRATGLFSVSNEGWELTDVKGRIGDTDVGISAQVSKKPRWQGTRFQVSVEGPDLHGFIRDMDLSDLPVGSFKSRGDVLFTGDALRISDFIFESPGLHANLELELGLPVRSAGSAIFDINLRGDDVRHLVRQNDWFDPALSAYQLSAAGHKAAGEMKLRHFDMNIGALTVSMQGGIGKNTSNSNIVFSATSDDLSSLGAVKGHPLPALPLKLGTVLEGNAQQFTLRDINGSLGESDFSGTLGVDLLGDRPKINLQVQSRLVDLGPFFEAGEVHDQGEPVEHDSRNGRIIPATPIPVSVLDMADTDFSFNIDEFKLPLNKVFNLTVEGETSSGALRVPRLSWSGQRSGEAGASLEVIPSGDGAADVKIDFDSERAVFNYTGLTRGEPWLTPEVDIQVTAQGNGSNLQELAGSMNGRIFVGSEGGTLKDVNLSLLDTFILDEVFKLIFAKSDDDEDDLVLTCMAAAFNVADGVLKTDPAYTLSTDKIRLIARGSLDLNTETLHFNFNATPRNILKISPSELINPYILVSGTLGKPVVGIDPAKAIIHGGAAIGTSGVSILAKAVLDRMGGTTPLCEKILEQGGSD